MVPFEAAYDLQAGVLQLDESEFQVLLELNPGNEEVLRKIESLKEKK